MGSLVQDVRYGMRQLRLHPGFALTAILSLALGIGANTAIFTLVDQVLVRLLPVQNPHELVQLRLDGGRAGNQNGDGLHTFSYPLYLAFRDRNTVLNGLTGQVIEGITMAADGPGELVRTGLVAGNFFQVLGVAPYAGRVLAPDDSRSKNGEPVAVLQYDFWKSRFGGRPGVVGSTLRLNGTPLTVVGIAAAGFEGTDVGLPTSLWVPVTMKPTLTPPWDDLDNERSAWFYLFGRMKPGMTIERAQAAMKVLYSQRQQEELKSDFFTKFPEFRDRFLRGNFTLVPAARGQSYIRQGFERPLIVLQWLVGFVLLIACTNVANLLLARAVSRQREVAIRGALGAGRGRLVRQLLIESVLLAGAGGVAGLALSSWVAKGLVRFMPFDPAMLSLSTTPDVRILLFTAATVLITAVVFGLVPALRGSRVSAATTLKQEAGAVVGGHGHVGLRKSLVALQVGLSCLLLISAGLFSRTIQNLRSVKLGFDTENVVMFGVRPATVYDEARKQQEYRTLLESLASVPGVKAAGANSTRLLTGGRWDSWITLPGAEAKAGGNTWSFFNAVTPGYFAALGIPIKAGRDFTWADWGGSRKLCLVNEALVKQYLGGASPIGRMLAQGARKAPDTEIVGVFADTKYHDVRGEIPRQIFVNLDSRLKNQTSITVYARVQGDPRQVMPRLREQARRVDPSLVITDMRPMDEQLNMRLANERLLSFLSAGLALLASILAVVGLNGVLAFVVARRTREIGIRMALGAAGASVVRLVMREMMLVILLGIAAGAGAALLAGRLVQTQLFGIRPADPPVYAASVAALLAASLAAALAPAVRAARIDPIRALRHE